MAHVQWSLFSNGYRQQRRLDDHMQALQFSIQISITALDVYEDKIAAHSAASAVGSAGFRYVERQQLKHWVPRKSEAIVN